MSSQIDYDSFLKWANDYFGSENIKIKGDEICTHSVFTEDHKFHLWMNPFGGKKELAAGAYRCWYTDRSGSLVSLVSLLEKIPYDEAEDLISGPSSLRELERKLDNFFNNHNHSEVTHGSTGSLPKPSKNFSLPDFTFKLDEMSKSHFYYIRAYQYLNKRKIPIDELYVCIEGDYKNRIVIPYYDKLGKLVYYNARTLSNNSKVLRYKKPDDKGINQTDYLYCFKWPRKNSFIYLTEGEFDARTLDLIGFTGIACGGKSLSDPQVELIRDYIPVIAFDNDEDKKENTGEKGLITIGNKLLEKGFTEIYFIIPPKGYKDWNEVFVSTNGNALSQYIEKYKKRFTSWTASKLRFNHI